MIAMVTVMYQSMSMKHIQPFTRESPLFTTYCTVIAETTDIYFISILQPFVILVKQDISSSSSIFAQ